MKDEEAILLGEMLKKPPEIERDSKLTLFYISGYLAFKHKEHRGEVDQFQSDVSEFFDALDRGSLQYLTPQLFNFVQYSFHFFSETKVPRVDIMK